MKVENIYGPDKTLIAWIVRKDAVINGKEFLSQKENSLQVGYMSLNKDEKIVPHFHKVIVRDISKTQEVIYVINGKMKVNFYKDKIKFSEFILSSGDLITILDGEHGFDFLEKTEIFEVKQGPYLSVEDDKVKFVPVGEDL